MDIKVQSQLLVHRVMFLEIMEITGLIYSPGMIRTSEKSLYIENTN